MFLGFLVELFCSLLILIRFAGSRQPFNYSSSLSFSTTFSSSLLFKFSLNIFLLFFSLVFFFFFFLTFFLSAFTVNRSQFKTRLVILFRILFLQIFLASILKPRSINLIHLSNRFDSKRKILFRKLARSGN